LIGHLQYLRALRLANSRQLHDALVAAKKAQVYAPSLEAATSLMTQLIDVMKDLQARMADVEQQLRQRHNVSLTADGKIALAQARQGYGPLESYLKSDELAQVVAARGRAEARSVWLEMGLPPEESDWDGRAAALLEVANSIYSTEPATLEALEVAFERERVTRPNLDLARINPRAVAEFIKRRRENKPSINEDIVAPLPFVAKIPVLEPSERAASSDREPLGYWFFGHQDYGARLAALVAVVAVLVVTGAMLFDAYESHVRASAYATIVAAVPEDDDRTVAREAGRFLAAKTLRHVDPRFDQVRALLAHAQEAPNRRVRNAAIAEMEAALKTGDDLGVLRAVEKFATAPPLNQKDARIGAVRDIYAREFVHWFAGLDVSADVDAQALSETYQRVSDQLSRMAGELK
jgi:hypothetical protein